MKNKLNNILLIIGFSLLLMSCSDTGKRNSLQSIDFGESSYYEPFLWVKSDTTVLKRKLKFEFSDYAVEQHAQLELQFTDNNQNVLNNNQHVNIFVDSILVRSGKIKIEAESNIVTKTIGLQFLPGSDPGDYHGFLIIKNRDFDRVNEFDSNQLDSDNRILRWSAYYDADYNPLAFGLFFLFIVLIAALFIWFVLLRNQVYPKMKRGKIVINTPYYKTVSIKGARRVTFTTKREKQKLLNKIFAGKILYEVNPIWEPEIVFTPARKRMMRIKLGIGYAITPFTTTLKQGSVYEIKKKNEIIKLSYL